MIPLKVKWILSIGPSLLIRLSFSDLPDHRSQESHISFQAFLLAFPLHSSPLHCSTLKLSALSWESGDLTQKQKHTGEWLHFQPITMIQIKVTISTVPVGIQGWCNFRKLTHGHSKCNPQIARSVTFGPRHTHQLEEQWEPESLTTWWVQPMGSRSHAWCPYESHKYVNTQG